jgi:plasmid stabilization system protein ParE
MKDYELSAGAESDLEAIAEFIALDNLDAAERWITGLFAESDGPARSPGKGHMRQDLTSHSVLFGPVEAYLIIYRSKGDDIEIVAVAQGARDIPSFLRRRS